jgi:SAM-dependent methyltransferase
MHRGLVGARQLVGAPYLADPELRREYEAEIAPRTLATLGKLLPELYLASHPAPARVLDLGAGTGAVGSALRDYFGDGVDVVAVDRVPGPGILVADLARGLPPVEGRFDLVVAAHLLNELYVDAPLAERVEALAQRLLAWCRAFIGEGGMALVIEPALKETSRALLAVRDRMIGSGLRVVAPCLWAGACPALERERDWCHDAAPSLTTGGPRVDFSYLALRTTGEPSADPALFRIVSDRLVEKGRLRLYGCGPVGRHALVLLDKHATPRNAAFGELARGDLARVSGTQFARDGLRLTTESTVARYVPAEKSSL